MRFSGRVHFHLTGTGAAAHTDVFNRTAKSGSFMSLEMGQGNQNICVHNGTPNFGFFYISTGCHGIKTV